MSRFINSSYHYDDGTNISKVIKKRKVNNGKSKFEKLKLKYDIVVIEIVNNTICFQLGNKTYYYGIPSQKIRLKGENIWTSKIAEKLKFDFSGDIPNRKK